MTIKDLAELLVEQGHDIKLRKRADGGYIISKIVTDVTEISDGLLTGFTSLVSGIVTILATLVIEKTLTANFYAKIVNQS